MNRKIILPILLIFLVAGSFGVLPSCDNDKDESDSKAPDDDDDDNDDNNDDADDDDNDNEPPGCDSSTTPIIFAHGFIENGDAFFFQAMRFASNGYCLDRIFTYDWNTILASVDWEGEIALFEQYVDRVLEQTGADRVDMLGHSMGGGLCFDYLAKEDNRSKVAHYVNVASWFPDEIPEGVEILSLSSKGDAIMGESIIEGAKNVVFENLDHLQVATAEESFIEMYAFFNGAPPENREPVPKEPVLVSGRIVSFGLNSPMAGITLNIYPFDPQTGQRATTNPDHSFVSGLFGYWGPFEASAETYYEFECIDPNGFWPKVRYYHEPFVRSIDKAYFRVLPRSDKLPGFFSALLPISDNTTIFAWLDLNQAVVHGRDTLTLNGIDLSIPELADSSIQTIALFFMDANLNGQSDLEAAGGIFASIPFVRVFDMRVTTGQPQPLLFEFNGRKMAIPNLKSRSEGLPIALFY